MELFTKEFAASIGAGIGALVLIVPRINGILRNGGGRIKTEVRFAIIETKLEEQKTTLDAHTTTLTEIAKGVSFIQGRLTKGD